MTRTTSARLAGFLFLFYIATGITSMVLFGHATSGAHGTAATLASIRKFGRGVKVSAPDEAGFCQVSFDRIVIDLAKLEPLAAAPSFELAALCWISACVALLLFESSPI